MDNQRKTKTIISFGLIAVFLFTAIALPIVCLPFGSNHNIGFEIKSSDGTAKQNAQLPLAEKESEEEEESLTEKNQNISFVFINGLDEKYTFSIVPVNLDTHYSASLSPSSVPLYLSKRTLLIW